MILATLVGAAVLAQTPAKPVTLGRVFKAGQKFVYDVKSHLQGERRGGELDTFIPEDLDINYSFTAEVVQMKPDGIAVIRYKRPTMTIIEGETFDSPPKSKVEKINLDFLITISPANELLEMKEQKPPPKKAKWMRPGMGSAESDPLGMFINELYRLALFTGNFESALDFSPKLPFTEVTVGETWKRTVGYQPQSLKGKAGQSAVQRLDYTYTYNGLVASGGKSFQRITAALDLNTDLAPWAKQVYEFDASDDRLHKLPLKLKANIEFDLDPTSGHTVAARATSEGGFQVFLASSPGRAEFEENLRGRTTLKLKPAPAAATTPKKPL